MLPCSRAIHAVLEEFAKNTVVLPQSAQSVEKSPVAKDWLEVWLQHKASEVRESTLRGYRQVIENHITPVLGAITLEALQPKHIDLLHQGMRDKELSFRMLEYAHVLMHGALDYAVRLELIAANVAQRVGLPKGKACAEIQVWTFEQARQFLDHLHKNHHRLYALYYTALTTGMRRGELVALRWTEVSLEQGLIQVKASMLEISGKKVFSEPKTRASKRKIALSQETVDVLKNHRQLLQQEKAKQGDKWQGFDLVFPSTIGTPLDRGTYREGSMSLLRPLMCL